MKTIYNEGRVIGLSQYELYLRQFLADYPESEAPSEREWLASNLANGASMILKVPSGTPSGYSDFELPANSMLCAGNTLVAVPFLGSADFEGDWAVRVTSYGDLISNTEDSHPTTPGESSDVPGDNSTTFASAQKAMCKEYSKIMWGICFQPGTWTEYGQHGVGAEFSPDLTKPSIVRVKLIAPTTSDLYILIQGFSNRLVLKGTSSFEPSLDSPCPENGDFLGPQCYPWASKIVFIEPSEILQFKQNCKLTHSLSGVVNQDAITDVDEQSISEFYSTNNFDDSAKGDSVSDISASPNGANLLGVYPTSDGNTPPALYTAKVDSEGQQNLYPVDIVAPGTVKVFRDRQLAINYSTLLKHVFGMYLDENNQLSMYDESGNPVNLGSELEVSATPPYIAKISSGADFIKTISLVDGVSGSDLPLDGSGGSESVESITWARLLSILATNKTIKISKAESATKDGSGNVITTKYGSSLGISGHTVQLKNPGGTVVSSITVPDDDTKYYGGNGIDLGSGNSFNLHALHSGNSTFGPGADSTTSIAVPQITFDAYGRMVSGANRSFDPSYTSGKGISISGKTISESLTASNDNWFGFHEGWTGVTGAPWITMAGMMGQMQCLLRCTRNINLSISGDKHLFYLTGNCPYTIFRHSDIVAVITASSDSTIVGKSMIARFGIENNLSYLIIQTNPGTLELPSGTEVWITGCVVLN